jgi:HK97 family phage prohead protease
MPKYQREHKAYTGHLTKADGETGVVTAIVSVFGIVDGGNDMIVNGAFSKTLVERGRQVRVLDAHNSFTIEDVIGMPLSIREVTADELPVEIRTMYPEATGGLETVTKYALETNKGRTAFNLIKGGFVNEYSIGFECLKSDFVAFENGTVRLIKEARFWEYSPVIWGMNPATATVSVKSAVIDTFIKQLLGETKAGRVLSAGNAERLRNAFQSLYAIMDDAGLLDIFANNDDDDVDSSLDESAEPKKSLTIQRENIMKAIQSELENLK